MQFNVMKWRQRSALAPATEKDRMRPSFVELPSKGSLVVVLVVVVAVVVVRVEFPVPFHLHGGVVASSSPHLNNDATLFLISAPRLLDSSRPATS